MYRYFFSFSFFFLAETIKVFVDKTYHRKPFSLAQIAIMQLLHLAKFFKYRSNISECIFEFKQYCFLLYEIFEIYLEIAVITVSALPIEINNLP